MRRNKNEKVICIGNNNKPTVKEHYVPRMILKRHAAECVVKKKTKYYTYLHDKQTGHNKKVDIYDICFENNLYELRDENGKIIDVNRIEKNFSILENVWNQTLNKVENDEALTEKDEAFVYSLFAFQILRVPDSQKIAKDFLKNNKPALTDAEADRYAKISSLIAGEIKPEINFLLELVLKPISSKHIAVYHSKKPFMLSCNQPVYGDAINSDIDDVNFFYPVSKNTCIALLRNKPDKNIMDISDNFATYLNNGFYEKAARYVCSSVPICRKSQLHNA